MARKPRWVVMSMGLRADDRPKIVANVTTRDQALKIEKTQERKGYPSIVVSTRKKRK